MLRNEYEENINEASDLNLNRFKPVSTSFFTDYVSSGFPVFVGFPVFRVRQDQGHLK